MISGGGSWTGARRQDAKRSQLRKDNRSAAARDELKLDLNSVFRAKKQVQDVVVEEMLPAVVPVPRGMLCNSC